MNICVYGASSDAIDKEYIKEVEKLGEEMARRGHGLVYGAGAQGLMGAAARGMTKFGGDIVGVSPSFFKVDGVLYDKCTEMIFTETMRERKQIMEERADAFIVTPGGVGTFEEFFEILTLKQLNRHQKAIAIFNIKGYYNELESFMSNAAKEEFMKKDTLGLYKMFDDMAEMLDYIEGYKPCDIDIKSMKHIG